MLDRRFPPTVASHSALLVALDRLAGSVKDVLTHAAKSLPDRAPFEMSPKEYELWAACERAEAVLARYGLQDGQRPGGAAALFDEELPTDEAINDLFGETR